VPICLKWLGVRSKNLLRTKGISDFGLTSKICKGLKALPAYRTSKCRCGPVLYPVEPPKPNNSPALTTCPTWQLSLECFQSIGVANNYVITITSPKGSNTYNAIKNAVNRVSCTQIEVYALVHTPPTKTKMRSK